VLQCVALCYVLQRVAVATGVFDASAAECCIALHCVALRYIPFQYVAVPMALFFICTEHQSTTRGALNRDMPRTEFHSLSHADSFRKIMINLYHNSLSFRDLASPFAHRGAYWYGGGAQSS